MRKIAATTLFVLSGLLLSKVSAQCTWSTYFYDSFEYNTVIPWIIPGKTYQNTPQNWAGCVHAGSLGMYLNIVDGETGLIYDQTFDNLCTTTSYRFSFWTRDTWTGANNLTFQVVDANNIVLSTQNVINNSNWVNVTMPVFTPTTSTIHFRITTNVAGGINGNDVGIDELTLSVCSPAPTNTTVSICTTGAATNLYTSIPAPGLSQNGVWTGPSALTNGYQGTFTPGTNAAGTYTYTIDAGGNCPDSVANIQVQNVNTPVINPLGPINNCGPYTLPAITGTNLTANAHYYTGPNGTGTMLATGSAVTTSQTVYMYDGVTGCSDNEAVTITISAPVNAGADNGAAYCGPGPLVNLNFFLSPSAGTTGIWSETTTPASGAFNAPTAQFTSASVTPGTYTFSYTLAGNGACPPDQANITLTFGNIPDVDLGNDTTLCTGQTLTLNAGVYDNYLWNNGSTGATKFVSNPGGTYWVRTGTLGQNQIVNGDFEQTTNNFTTQYGPGTGGAFGLLTNPGTFAITTSPNLVHNNFNSCNDHTPNPGNRQMVVNGAATANTQVWCQSVPIQPNTDYQFGTWVTSVQTPADNVPQLQFSINSVQIGSTFSPTTQGCSWSQFTQNWFSGMTTSAQICIVNQNINGGGNDFAIDDITFKPVCYSYDTIVVQYSTNPVVNLGPDQFHCAGDSVTLDALNPGMTYQWNTSANDTLQTITVGASGAYAVTVTNASNCSASDAVVISYEAQKNAGNDSLTYICSTATQFNLSNLLSANATPGGQWENGPNPFTGTLAPTTGVATLNGESGTFDFRYIVSGTYCQGDTSVMTLIINQQPVAAPDVSLHLCNTMGTQVDFTPYLNHPFEPITGAWTVPANLPAGSFNTGTNVLALGGLPHDGYTFSYALPSDSGCVQDTFKLQLAVTAVPIIQFSPDTTSGCQPLQVSFINESIVEGSADYVWDLGDGTGSVSATGVTNVYEAAQCYDITLTITADNLCTATKSVNDLICVHPLPQAQFTYGPQQVFSDGPVVQFNNTSTNNDFNDWDFDDGTSSAAANPEHVFPIGQLGNYEVRLIVETQFGCLDTAYQVIVVRDQLLYYIPNTFTPDDDEYNPIFLPVLTAGIDPYDFNMQIYNRWGEVVFETNDANVGWDGTYHGTIVKEGTYAWKIRFGLLDSDEVRTEMGHVNLIR